MASKDYWAECVSNILEERGIEFSPEQLDIMVEDFSTAAQMESEYNSYSHNGGKAVEVVSVTEVQKAKDNHDAEIARLNKEIDIYRGSVARRHNVRIQDVYTQNGEIHIY